MENLTNLDTMTKEQAVEWLRELGTVRDLVIFPDFDPQFLMCDVYVIFLTCLMIFNQFYFRFLEIHWVDFWFFRQQNLAHSRY